MKHEVDFGKQKISFQICRKAVKNVNLNIRADGSVVITANHKVPQEFIYQLVTRRANWINKQISYYKNYQPEVQHKELVSGETIKYLGKQYRLKVEESQLEYVKYYRGYIYLGVKDKNDFKHKQALLESWLNIKLEEITQELYKSTFYKMQKYDIPDIELQLRKMKNRWGSCLIEQNKIILNRNLIRAPKYCIEYVMVHEFIHFLYPKHNKEFYNFLHVIMPDWKQRKKILDEEIVLNL